LSPAGYDSGLSRLATVRPSARSASGSEGMPSPSRRDSRGSDDLPSAYRRTTRSRITVLEVRKMTLMSNQRDQCSM
jgi:hypothetical protein